MSTNQYDSNEKAKNYNTYASTNLFYQKIYFPTIKEFFGSSLENKRVLDLACGSGGSTRFLAKLKPKELIGIDISQNMVDLAINFSANYHEDVENLKNIKYICKDCSTPIELGMFDVVFSLHYLNYAHTKQKLFEMVKSMYESTKPGGLCSGIMVNPFVKNESFEKLNKYCVKFERQSGQLELNVSLYDGHVKDNKLLISFKNYIWQPELYEATFRECGFENFEWCCTKLGDEFKEENEFFEDYFQARPHVFFKAQRPLLLNVRIIT